MSSSRFATPISLRPDPSRLLAVSILAVHLGAFSIVLWLRIPGIVKVILALIVLINLIVSLRVHVFMIGKRVVRQLVWPLSESIRIEDGVGNEHRVELAWDSIIHPWILVLNLIDESRTRHTLILFPDSSDRDVLRCLRTRLLLDRK